MKPTAPWIAFKIRNKTKFLASLALTLLGIWMPSFFTVYSFHVMDNLHIALLRLDSSYLLLASLQLALLNAVRCFPHYIGAFFAGEAVLIQLRGRGRRPLSALLVVGLIVLVYYCIALVHGIRYDFGVPALSLVTLQVALWLVNYAYISPLKKVPMMMCFITAFQFLDVMPALGRFPFGRGETSQLIKQASSVLEMDRIHNGMCLLFFTIFLLMGLMLLLALRDENHLRQIAILKDQSERIKTKALIQEQENRTYQEMQHLVHDLKSPLTAMQNLVGVMQFSRAFPEQAKEREYLAAMEGTISNMNRMISELLYENSRTLMTTSALLGVVRAQASVLPYSKQFAVENDAPEAYVEVNCIRMSRAIINLLDNASQALPEEGGLIRLSVARVTVQGFPAVRICVQDNGSGIPPQSLPHIWEKGYSGRGSHGLGLPFVRDIVRSSGGEITVQSEERTGTTFTIDLPEGALDNES